MSKRFPSANEVRNALGHVDIGAYRVSRNPFDQQQNMRFLWRVHGPEKKVGPEKGLREELDTFATYREAVLDARKREKQDRVNGMLQHSKLGHFGPKMLAVFDNVIAHLLDIYHGERPTLEVTNPVLFEAMRTSRAARGLRGPKELPEQWGTEEQTTGG